MSSQFYALLVGIDRYDNPAQAPHLRGCVADVEGTYRWLIEQMGFPEENVRLLTSRMDQSEPEDSRATRANILKGWEEHLMQAGPGDQVFFNYSGHGAQARSIAPENASGYDETMVTCDSRTPGVFDILDKELAQLIENVEKRGAQVTVFLDCCHSGSGTRGPGSDMDDENAPRVRKCHADERERPLDQLVAGVAQSLTASTRSARSTSGWVPLGKHVLLAGCRDEELSHEYRSPETGQWQGATTYFFHKAMANFRADMTWADVHDFVQTHVHKVYPRQSPQLEGPANMQIFGGAGSERKQYLLVTELDGQHFVKLNAGVTAGLSRESTVAIYPPESNLSGEPIVTGTVDDVKVDHTWIKLDQATDVALASRVKVTNYGIDEQTLIVAVDDSQLRQSIENSGSGFLEVVSINSPAKPAQYMVTVEDGSYVIKDAVGSQVVDDRPNADGSGAASIVTSLEHLAIYNNVLALRNPSSFSEMANAVAVEDLASYTQRKRNYEPLDPKPLRTSESGNEAVLTAGEGVYFKLRNTTDDYLYLAVFEMTPDFGVKMLYPSRGRYERVAAGREIPIPIKTSLDNPRLSKGRFVYKVVASSEPTELDVLELPELNKGDTKAVTRSTGGSSLGRLLNHIRVDGTRGSLDYDETDNQWSTEQFEITVVAKNQATEVSEGSSSVEVTNTFIPIAMSTPEGFGGTVSVGGFDQSTRSVGDTVVPPPGMDNPDVSQYFELVTLGAGTRSASSSPLVMTVESDASQLNAVTPETPAQVELAVPNDPDLRGIIPVAFDGESYYVVGRSNDIENSTASAEAIGTRSIVSRQRKVTVNLEYLPAIGSSKEIDEFGDTRDLKRTARLFFYKVFRKELPEDTGVRKGTLDSNGRAVYAPVSATDIGGATKVALMIHGLTADTVWLVEKVWPLIVGEGYDLCLTYDYETFGTGIKENGQILHEKLTELGLSDADNVHLDIYCHSMGTLVARSVIELLGGDAYVDRVFMGGPPNAGSPLAKLRGYVPWLGTVMINQIGAIPASMLLSWSLNSFVESGKGIADLDPDSDFYKELNPKGIGRTDSVVVPYFIQIGNNQGAYSRWNKIFRVGMRISDAALDQLFEGDHDLAVGVNSACAVETNRWPNAQVAKMECNHFGYFHTIEGRQILSEWLRK